MGYIDKAAPNLAGRLLIAMPSIAEGQLAHSVIFMCQHSDQGALGIQLNQPVTAPSFDDLLRQLDVMPVPPARRIRIMSGGPVDHARGFVLHSADWSIDASLQVDPRHVLTSSLDVLKAIAEGGGPAQGFLALGYVGWAAGQLEDELQRWAWLTAPPDDALIFDGDHETKWRRALAKLHIDPRSLSRDVGHG